MFFRQICSYGFQKEKWIFWELACRQTHWSAKINSRCWSFLLRSYCCNLKVMEAIPNQSSSYPKNCGRPSRVTASENDRYIDDLDKRNRRSAFPHVTPMAEASIGKTIYVTPVCQRLHTPGCSEFVFLYPTKLEGQFKVDSQHITWIVTYWGNNMFTDESRFELQPVEKHIRAWKEVVTRNRL